MARGRSGSRAGRPHAASGRAEGRVPDSPVRGRARALGSEVCLPCAGPGRRWPSSSSASACSAARSARRRGVTPAHALRALQDDRRRLQDDRRRSRAARPSTGVVPGLRWIPEDAGRGAGDAVPARGDRGSGKRGSRSGGAPHGFKRLPLPVLRPTRSVRGRTVPPPH